MYSKILKGKYAQWPRVCRRRTEERAEKGYTWGQRWPTTAAAKGATLHVPPPRRKQDEHKCGPHEGLGWQSRSPAARQVASSPGTRTPTDTGGTPDRAKCDRPLRSKADSDSGQQNATTNLYNSDDDDIFDDEYNIDDTTQHHHVRHCKIRKNPRTTLLQIAGTRILTCVRKCYYA